MDSEESIKASIAAHAAVPSITLSITQDDIKHVKEASKAIHETMIRLEKENAELPREVYHNEDNENDKEEKKEANDEQISKPETVNTPKRIISMSDASACSVDGTTKATTPSFLSRPLHERLYEAAKACDYALVGSFLEKMENAGASLNEVKAGTLLFHDVDKSTKLQYLFDVLRENDSGREYQKGASPYDDDQSSPRLDQKGAISLFRTILTAISSCIHRDTTVKIEMDDGETSGDGPPKKKSKLIDHLSPNSNKSTNDNSSGSQSVPALHTPTASFDSALDNAQQDNKQNNKTTAHDAVRKEFDEIANFASQELLEYAREKNLHRNDTDNISISFEVFGEWYNSKGSDIVPWLELLHLSKWQTPERTSVSLDMLDDGLSILDDPDIKDLALSPHPAALSPYPAVLSPTYGTTAAPEVSLPTGRTVVSFDFAGSNPHDSRNQDNFCINITEENIETLRKLVRRTGLYERQSRDICNILLEAATSREVAGEVIKVISAKNFRKCMDDLLAYPRSYKLSIAEKDFFLSCFFDFFGVFENRNGGLKHGEVDAEELAVGFCFLCAGNKSIKLATGFEIMEVVPAHGLTSEQLTGFLRSYLSMLVGMSLLTSNTSGGIKTKIAHTQRRNMLSAVENGARWTFGHFLKVSDHDNVSRNHTEKYSFERFANWYTSGGFNVAPWLELLDLNKLLSLVIDDPQAPPPSSRTPERESMKHPPSSKRTLATTPPRRRLSHGTPSEAHAEVLFTFPLANKRSLVVLREDATYVRSVVEQLGLLKLSPDEIWTTLFRVAKKQPPLSSYNGSKAAATDKSLAVNKATFVKCMQETIQCESSNRKRTSSGMSKAFSGAKDILANFFHSFDLHQLDRVALNELMGGLTLLCGGKKSTKLSFAFGVFDNRTAPKSKKGKSKPPPNSLGGQDLFLFLRSFLIVMFSCCRQSWDLSDDAVGRYIADTANMVTEDVMRYQWHTRKRDRVDFDEFGEWYNEGGFETAPWLELLDLKKWVLGNHLDELEPPKELLPAAQALPHSPSVDFACPPPPPDDAVDPSFFVDDDSAAIMHMDSMEEMDMILMQQPSQDKENDIISANKLSRSFSYSPRPSRSTPQSRSSNSLRFYLVTDDEHGGYRFSISQKRIHHLRHILMESNLHKVSGEVACDQILSNSSHATSKSRSRRHSAYSMSKDDFDCAMRGIIASKSMSVESQRTLSDVLSSIFKAFDRNRSGTVNALEVACGFTVLCHGKKSDKLEHAFEVLDRDKRGNLSQEGMARYLRSFLTVLLSIASTTSLDTDSGEDTMTTMNGNRCDPSSSTLLRAVEAGSDWAAAQAFKNHRSSHDVISFDDFAEWYTHVGYKNISWLELLDLHKWVVTD